MAAPTKIGTPGAAVESASSVAFPTTLTPSTGSGYAVGDLLVCYTASWGGFGSTVATPANWTKILDVAADVGRIVLFGKVAASTSEAAPSVVWSPDHTGSTGDPALAQVVAFRGVDVRNLAAVADVIGAVSNIATSFSQSAGGAAITTLSADDVVFSLTARRGSSSPATLTAPSGFTLVVTPTATTSGNDMIFGWASQAKTTPGSVSTAVFGYNGNTANSIGVMIALKAAPVGVINNDTCSGTLSLSGSCVDSYAKLVIYNDAPAGSVALAGTCVDAHSRGYSDAPAGTIGFSGACVDLVVYTDAPSGRVVFTGTCVDQKLRVYNDAPTATLALAGTATSTHRRVYSDAPAGALALTGSATSEHIPPTPYMSAVLETAGLISYWRLGESQGTATDSKDGNNLDPHNVARVTGLLADDPNGAMEVSGVAGSYLDTINNLNPGQRLTWEFWCRPTAVPARTASVISKTPPLVSGTWLISHQADGRWNAMVRDINGVATTIGPIGPAVAAGKIQHVVMTYDSVAGQMKLFINGVSVGSQSRTPNAAVQTAGGPSYFGGTPNFANGFVGVIDELAYYNVALTPAQIQAHYELGGGAAVDTPQGQIPLGGSCVDAFRRQSTSTGTLKLAGSKVERWGHVDKPQGNVSLTGSVVEEWLPPKIYGTLPLSGTVQESFSRSSTPVGSLKLAGTAVAKRRYADEASGDIAVTGAAEDNREISDVCAGVLRLAGVLSENLSVSVEVDGTIRLSGRNSEFITINDKIFYDDFVTGSLRLRGFVVVVSEDITPGRGGRVVEGLKTGRIVRQLDTGRVVGNLTGRVTS
jgi:hypothetical protein